MLQVTKQIRLIGKFSRILGLSLGILMLISTVAWGVDGGSSGTPVYNQQAIGQAGIGSTRVGICGVASESYPMGDVALGYSNSGGWSLGGHSAITRSVKYGIPKYNSSDTFMLDGEELAYIQGSNPRIYRKKRDSFEKVEFYNPESVTQSYWVVKHPDGSRSLYAAEKGSGGDTPVLNGRARAIGGRSDKHGDKPWGWYITESWSRGNYDRKNWEYDQYTNGWMVLTKVLSGKGSMLLPYQITLIKYKSQECGWIDYRTGSRQFGSFPDQVIVYRGYKETAGGNSYNHGGKYYQLANAYQIASQAGVASEWQVASITPYGSDAVIGESDISGTPLNPTRYQYYGYNGGFVPQPSSTLSGHNKNLRSDSSDLMDINADGLVDFVVKENNNTLTVWFNQGNFSFSHPMSFTLGDNNRKLYDEAGFMDADKDDYPDRFIRNNNRLEFWKNNLKSGGGFVRDTSLDRDWDRALAAEGTRPGVDGANGLYQAPLDVDGDGEPEKVKSTGSNGNYGLEVAKKNGTVDQYINNNPSVILRAILTPQVVNGFKDTISDLMDLNGDGLPDQVYQKNGNFEARLNMGYGFDINPIMGVFDGTPENDGGNLVDVDTPGQIHYTNSDYLDINGDGLPDRVKKTNGDLEIWYNTGIGFRYFGTIGGADNQALRVNPDYGRQTNADYIDLNGDGYPDRVIKQSGSNSLQIWENRICGANPGEYAGRLKKVIGSNGGSTLYRYRPVTDREYRPIMWVVTSQEVSDGKGDTYVTTCQYSDGVYDPLEREFRGFGNVKTFEPTGNFTDSFYYTDPDKKGLPDAVHHFTQLNKQTGWVKYEYGAPVLTVPGNDKVKFIPLVKEHQYTNDCTAERREVETAYEYDAYGNVAKTVATESYNNDKRIGYNWYNYDTANWNLRQLKESVAVGYDKDRVFKVQGGAYNTYDNIGNPEAIYKWTEQTSTYSVGSDGSITRPSSSDSRWVRHQKFYYDSYGNVIQVKDARGNSTYTSYDIKYRMFPVNTISSLNHTTWNYYDYYGSEYNVPLISEQITLGRPTKTAFENTNFYSSQYYDIFGRVVKKVRMDYSQNYPTEKIDYTDAAINQADGDIITPASVKVAKRPLPGPEGTDNQLLYSYTYTDGMGRTIQTKTKYADSLYTTVDTWYQISGNQTKTITSEPYLTSTSEYTGRDSSQPQTVTSSWMDESEGSKSTVTGTDGSVVATTNKLWVTTVTDAEGNIRKSWSNGFGQTLEILEPIGTKTKYTYETGSGNLVQVRDAYGNLTTLQYNTLGLKIKEIDPDMGTTTYTYDANGNVISQTDAKCQTVTNQYDALNRPTVKTYPGTGNRDEFIYDNDNDPDFDEGYAAGKLVQTNVYRNNLLQEQQRFQYDRYGNMIYKYHWIDGKRSGISYHYDGLGRVISSTYPDTEYYTYQYDPTGYGLDSITRSSDGQKILDYQNYLPSGKINNMHFGNGIKINYEYWASNQVGADMLKRLYTTGTTDSLDLNYSYDRNGNVLTINDAINSHYNQSFFYDQLNRLTEMNGGFCGSQAYAYDGMGNMISKEGKTFAYGNFSGKGNKPHAVKNDGTYIYQYDAVGNLVEKRAIGSLAENIIQIPVNVLNYDIYGLDKVALNDRVELKTADGGYGPVGSPKEIELGQSAKAGTVTAKDKIYLRDYSEVYGDVVTRSGKLTQQNNVYIGGSINEVMGMDDLLPGVTANNIDFTGTPHTDTYVNSGQTATVAPGKYWNYTVHANGGLNLTSGVYYFNTLQMEGNSRLNMDETGGPVKIYVQQTLQMRAGTYHSKADKEGTANLLIGYVGTQDVYLGGASQFNGTVLAPNAKLIAGQEQNKVFEGMFIGKEVHFHQGSKVTCVPFIELVPEIYHYRYDWNDKLVQVQRNYRTVMTSKYGVDGNRIKKTEKVTDSYYFFVEYEEDWKNGALVDSAKYHFANGKRIAKENAAGELSFYVGDHLGSNTKVINEAKETVMTMRYMPYGGMAFESGTQTEDYRFNGKELDATGLYYYGARFYDPNLGRFISADTVTPGDGGDPQGLNRYSYCFNNPVKYVDPSGNEPEDRQMAPADNTITNDDRGFFKWQNGADAPYNLATFIRTEWTATNNIFRLWSNYGFAKPWWKTMKKWNADKGSAGLVASITKSLIYDVASVEGSELTVPFEMWSEYLTLKSGLGIVKSTRTQIELMTLIGLGQPGPLWQAGSVMAKIGSRAVPFMNALDVGMNAWGAYLNVQDARKKYREGNCFGAWLAGLSAGENVTWVAIFGAAAVLPRKPDLSLKILAWALPATAAITTTRIGVYGVKNVDRGVKWYEPAQQWTNKVSNKVGSYLQYELLKLYPSPY